MRILLLIGVLCSLAVRSQPDRSILYIGAKAHLGNGKVIANSAIAVKGGVFTMVTNALIIKVDSALYDTIIRLHGKEVYPGFIAPNSTLGLTEIDAVRATLDMHETGLLNPHVRSIIAYNTDSEILPTVRSNGILTAQVAPRGGLISGSSSVVTLKGDNWEEAAYKTDEGIQLNWPSMYKRTGWWAEPGTIRKADDYADKVEAIRIFFEEARSYDPAINDLRLNAMQGLFNGTKTLYVHADYIKEILEIIQFKRDLNIPKLVLVGGYDAWMATELLVENKIAVMVRRLHSLPERPEDDIDLPFKLAKILSDKGVSVCLQNEGDMEAMGARNLPFYAGTAVAYGMDYEQAVACITLNTAKILGIDDRTGSLEKGKEATFLIASGDLLDPRTHHIEKAFIRGEQIDLNNRQTELYKKYMQKYNLEIPEKHQ